MPIMGDCPYDDCTESLPWYDPPDNPPYWGFVRTVCTACNRPYWTAVKRFAPWSMTEPDFMEEYAVNHDTRKITRRDGSPVSELDHT